MSANGGALGIGTASDSVQVATIHDIDEKDYHRSSSSDPSTIAEKGDVINVTDAVVDEAEAHVFLSHEEQFPIDPDAPEEEQQLTFRAVFVGCCLGGVIAASK